MRRHFFSQMGAVAMLLAAGSLHAQEAGTLYGTAKDPSGKPLPGARVVIQSPALFQAKTLVASESGQWRMPLLPAGTYSVKVMQNGYNAAGRDGIRIGLGAQVRVDLVLTAVASEVVDVVAGAAGVVDKADAKAGTNLSAQALETLAAADRGFWGAVQLSPGMSTSGTGVPSVRGSSSQYTNFRVDGSDVKSDFQGNLGTWMIEDNVEDVQVALSGLNVRFGRQGGGAVNVVTKTGSNEFRGSLRAKVKRGNWYAQDEDTGVWFGQGNDHLDRTYDVTFNGPIIKDRLWFSIGTILVPSTTDSRNFARFSTGAVSPVMTGNAAIDKALVDGPGNGYRWTEFSSGQPYQYTKSDKYFEGKISGAITPDHTIEVAFQKKNYEIDKWDVYTSNQTIRPEGLGDYWWREHRSSFSYKGLLGNNLFLEARVGEMRDEFKGTSGDPAYGTGEYLLVYAGDGKTAGRRRGFGMPFGSGQTGVPEKRNNRTGNINAKWFPEWLGTHDMDFGVDYYQYYRQTSEQVGKRNLAFRVGGAYQNGQNYLFPAVNWTGYWINGQNDDEGLRGPAPTVIQYFGKDGTYKTIQTGYYVNDVWSLNKNWIVGMGLRMDQNEVIDTDGAKLLSSMDPTYSLMARWDPAGDSSHLFTLAAANYGNSFTAGFVTQFVKGATSAAAYRGWTGSPTGAVRFVDYNELTNLQNYKNVLYYTNNSKDITYDKNMKPSRVQEVSLKYQRSYGEGSRFGITLVKRRTLDMWATAIDYHPDFVVTLSDPSGSGLPDGQVVQSRVSNNSDLKRDYNGIEIEWQKQFTQDVSFFGNYTYGRAVGNWNDGDSSGDGFRSNASYGPVLESRLMTRMGVPVEAYAPYGPLVANQAQKGRLGVNITQRPSKEASLSWSFILSYDSGLNYSAANQAPIDTKFLPDMSKFSNLQTWAPSSYTQYYGGMGQYSTDDYYSVDLKLSWVLGLGVKKLQVIGDVYVSNLLNRTRAWSTVRGFYTAEPQTQLFMDRPEIFGRPEPGIWSNFYQSGRSVNCSLGLRF